MRAHFTDNAFYRRIEAEELERDAARIAKSGTGEEELRILAESTRLKFLFGPSKERIPLVTASFIASMLFLSQLVVNSLPLSLAIGLLLIELYWRIGKFSARSKLLNLQRGTSVPGSPESKALD